MADNESSFFDGTGQPHDWIELYNASDQAIDLLSWHLSDDAAQPQRWTLPAASLPPKGHLLVIASGLDFFDGSYWHTNFKLDKEGETLLLSNPNGSLADQVEFPALDADQSFGRLPDGSASFAIFAAPTPGDPNLPDGHQPHFSTTLQFSKPPGHHPGGLELIVWADRPDAEIHFTLDGSEPQPYHTKWSAPIPLNAANLPAAQLAQIPTADNWKAPSGEVPIEHVVRARAFRNGQPDSRVLTGTFFVGGGGFPYSLPVVSLATSKPHLFDAETGIYHKGLHENYQQYGAAWERPAHFEYFDETGNLLLAQDIGIRLSGFTTRAYPQKTLKLYARSEYGPSRFEHPFFGEDHHSDFKRLALRTLSGDWSQVGFTDDFCHELMLGEVAADHARRQFVVVLVNGEYWGIHSFREFIDQYFMAQVAGVGDEEITSHINWDSYAENGDPAYYASLLDFFNNHDLNNPSHFAKAEALIDIENFMDYFVLQTAFANADWPNNNVKFWKTDQPGSKWRWIAYDLDGCMKASNYTGLSFNFAEQRHHLTDWESREKSFLLLRKMLDNEPFRRRFHERLRHFLQTTMSPKRSLPLLHEMTEELSKEMPRHVRRWHFPKGMDDWEKGIEKLEHFLLNRPPFLFSQAMELLGSPVKIYPNPTTGSLYLDAISYTPRLLSIEWRNALGQVIFYEEKAMEPGMATHPLQLPSGAPAGLYYLRLSDGYLAWTERLVVR